MHPLFQKADLLSREVIGAAIEVHRNKGAGLIESIYERCLMRELELRKIAAVNQRLVRIEYKGLGLIINFHEEKLVDGIVRMMLPGANR